jgi:arylformamidase
MTFIRSAACISGIYDLRPVRLSSRNRYLNLTDDIEETLSPERCANAISTPLIVAYGTKESPEFIRQAKSLSHAVNRHRSFENQAKLLEIEGQNHFEVLEGIAQSNSVLGEAILNAVYR